MEIKNVKNTKSNNNKKNNATKRQRVGHTYIKRRIEKLNDKELRRRRLSTCPHTVNTILKRSLGHSNMETKQRNKPSQTNPNQS